MKNLTNVRYATATVATARLVVGALLAVAALSVSGCATAPVAGIARYDKVPDGAYAIVAEVRAKPGKEDELRAATLPLVAQVRRERNNLVYFLHEDRESPGRFIFYEIFAAQPDFEAHNQTRHVQEWFAKLPGLADGDVKVVRMKVLGG